MVNISLLNKLKFKKSYFYKLVASKQGGSLTVAANAKMFNSKLNGKISSMVKTEVQEIEITSTIVKETTVIIILYLFYIYNKIQKLNIIFLKGYIICRIYSKQWYK